MNVNNAKLPGHSNPTKFGKHFFPALLGSVRALLDKWHKEIHSWFGRCNIIKMNIVPKFLYLFQAVPIAIPIAYFSQIRAMFTKFISASKCPRISRDLFTLPKSACGVAVLDIFKYYQAAHLGRIIDWCRHGEYKLWATIEQSGTVPLNRAIWCYATLPTSLKSHPTIGPTVHIGYKIIQNPRFSTIHSPLFPKLGNLEFPPGLEPWAFENLREKGRFQVSHFLISDTWPTIDSLMQQGGQFEIHFWQALQVRHYLDTLWPLESYQHPCTKFELYCEEKEPLFRTISRMYAMLISPPDDFIMPSLSKWERELNKIFTLAQHQNIIHLALKSSVYENTGIQL